jgi:predicted lipoprotein with Yx(FWY)xxD motif
MINRHYRALGGAIALTSLLTLGTVPSLEAPAGAAPVRISPALNVSSSPVRSVTLHRDVTKMATIHTTITMVNGKPEVILVNSKDLPLYYYAADTPKRSLVNGELARLWPPLLSLHPTANVEHGKLTSLKVAAGHQVTYNGHFLYTFVEDSPGHVSGQGVSNFLVATPRLKVISDMVKSTPTQPSTGGGYPY